LWTAVPVYSASLRRRQRLRGLRKNCGPHFFDQKADSKRQAFFGREVGIEICE